MKKSLPFIIGFNLLFSAILYSQLTVTTNNNATTLVQSISGNNVTTSNATINCPPNASGTFTYVGANLGIPGGIILTTGNATDAANPGAFFCSVSNNIVIPDPDLMQIDTTAKRDVCILEFDIVPLCTTLAIKFVWASEEYPIFVNSINDVFGFFLTGPNPGGGNYNSTNVALIPGTGTPVSINTVHAGLNAQYFVDNYTAPNNHIAYDGYTVPMLISAQVYPCSTYHMKIALADAVDHIYDSAVFLEQGGLNCQSGSIPAVSHSSTPSSCGTPNGTATVNVTGSPSAVTYSWAPGGQTTSTISGLPAGTYICYITLANPCSITVADTVVVGSQGNLTATSSVTPATCAASNGTATITATGTTGLMYSWTTNPSQSTATATGLAPGTYTCIVSDSNGCSNTQTVTIVSQGNLTVSSTVTNITCNGANNGSATVTATGTTGLLYSWTTNPPQSTATATGLAPGTYTCIVADSNGCTGTQTVTVTQPQALSLNTSGVNVGCNGQSTGSASTTASGGTSPYTYSWNNGQLTANATGLPIGTYTVVVTDANGCTALDTVSINQAPPLLATTSSVSSTCNNSNGSASVNTSGGTPNYTYSWNSGQTTSVISGIPAGNYTVIVTDASGCTQAQTVTVTNNGTNPILVTSADTTILMGGSANITATGGVTYSWYPPTGLSCTQCPNPVATPASLTQYCVVAADSFGCTDTACVIIGVDIVCYEVFVPNAFSPNSDIVNDVLYVEGNCIVEMDFAIYDRWGERVFHSDNIIFGWDGTYRNKPMDMGVYMYYLKAKLLNGKEVFMKGDITLVR